MFLYCIKFQMHIIGMQRSLFVSTENQRNKNPRISISVSDLLNNCDFTYLVGV